MSENNKPTPTLEELSASMESMYHEHNAQVANLSSMITTLARMAGYGSENFAKEVKNYTANKTFADNFNKSLAEIMNNSNEQA